MQNHARRLGRCTPSTEDRVADVHPHDIGTILDTEGVAIRAGHHCTQPVMARFGIPATARASFSIYNTESDVERLVAAVAKVREVFV